jgi:hypothetical protein
MTITLADWLSSVSTASKTEHHWFKSRQGAWLLELCTLQCCYLYVTFTRIVSARSWLKFDIFKKTVKVNEKTKRMPTNVTNLSVPMQPYLVEIYVI